ncbi:hypothetical protein AAKU55_001610 [Oxalobacteraceae bacterium GrIS 1.11]
MEMTVFLEREGDWESLQGWANHTSGEVISPARGILIVPLVGGFLMATGAAIGWGNAATFLPYFFVALPCGYMLFRACRVRKALVALTANSSGMR